MHPFGAALRDDGQPVAAIEPERAETERDVAHTVAELASAELLGPRGMEHRVEIDADEAPGRSADHARRGRVHERDGPVERDADDAVRGGVEDQLVLTTETRELRGLVLELLVLAEEVHEDLDLRLEDLRDDRLEEVVDRADGVSLEDVRFVPRERRDEDDRRVAGLLALANQVRGLEAVHFGHLHVEEDDGEIVVEQPLQGLHPRLGADALDVSVGEHRLERDQVVRLIVDEEHLHRLIDGRLHRFGSVQQCAARYLAISSSERTRSTPAAIAAFGMAGASAVVGSCANTFPFFWRIRVVPAAPSPLAPVNTMPSTRGPNESAADSKRTSTEGRE